MKTIGFQQPRGMVAFVVVWIGQLVSILATNMTQFALTIFVYEKTGSATALGLMQVFYITPFLIISPFAGAMIDRYNRKLMMMLSDLGAGLATMMILVLQAGGALDIGYLYVAGAITGLFNAFQWPAYSASISLMVPKEQLGRVNGMMSLMEMGPSVIAPLLAGALLGIIGLTGILLIDVATFVLAVLALLIVVVPQPPRTEAGQEAQGSILKEAVFGFRYIFARPSLLGLQMVFFFGNLLAGIGFTVLAPMILARTGNNEVLYGATQTAGAVGGILGGVAMSAWGGFKRRVHGVLLGWLWSGVTMALVGLGHDLPIWSIALFLGAAVAPLINGSNQAIWQAKVAPDVQGRVFSARRLIAWFTNPITPLIAGPLADVILEPAMRNSDSALAHAFGGLVGVGPGAGMAIILIGVGLLGALVGLCGYLFKPVRDAENLLPDHDTRAKIETVESASAATG
ncbi:MAG: MFS transporter [Chloroflexi bacterium]|nr:MFS transporter [Chloroflexota bacterium]